MEFKGYNLIAVIDNFQEEWWSELESVIKEQDVNDVAKWINDRAGRDPEFMEDLPVCDEIVAENNDYIITYTDCGMCEQVMLYEKVNEEDVKNESK